MPESSFSVFVGTKHMTTISYGRNNNVQSNSNSYLYTFVYNDEHPETSAWVVNTEQNIPIYRRTTSASCPVVVDENGKTEIAILGGELESLELLGDTWFYSQGCPAGYEVITNNAAAAAAAKMINYCALCKPGYYSDSNYELDDQSCKQCPPLLTTGQPGSKSERDCNIPANDACNRNENVKYVDIPKFYSTGKVMCECSFWYVGDRCEYIGFFGLRLYIWIIAILGILLLMALFYLGRKYFRKKKFYKTRINEEIDRAELYTRMLDETKEEVKFRESELRHIQEGWKIRDEDIQLVKKIGRGSYANVYRGTWDALDNTPVAIKVLNVTPSSSKKSIFNDTETQVLQRIRHPRLVLFFGCGQLARGNDFIVTEYVDGGDLRSVLLKEKKAMKLQSPLLNVDAAIYPSQKRLQYALDIAEGMAFLHSKRFIHRDLKSANILCTRNGRCRNRFFFESA